MLLAPLFSGPLDLVGDVHGEFGALQALLSRLGYRPDGLHPAGRRLVFVGDLVDRGPESVSVLRWIRPLLAGEHAQCLMGNHELNLLRRDRKHGNDWFFGPPSPEALDHFGPCEWLEPGEQAWVDAMLEPLPLALERPDLRVVHASWCPASLRWCHERMAAGDRRPVAEWYAELEARVDAEAASLGLTAAMEAEREAMGPFPGPGMEVPPLRPAFAEHDAFLQMHHALAVLCSGQEMVSEAPFWANGKWRMTDRVPWWREYADTVPVVFGHYWRWTEDAARRRYSRGEPDLFIGCAPLDPLPTRGAPAWCVDFSVGARYRQRQERRREGRDPEGEPFAGRLAALRWPEREWVFDSD